MPPVWRSNVSPRYFIDIAEHSMCQPGRPRPHGESQPTGPSLSSHAFQSAKSPTFSLSYSSAAQRAPVRWWSKSMCASFP